MNRKPLTFRKALANGFGTAFMLVMLGCAAVFAPAFASEVEGPVATPYSEGTDSLDRPVAAGSSEALVAKHHCWTHEAPKGAVPTHVVSRTEAGDWTYAGEAVVADAFEQMVFDGVLDANEFTKAVNHNMQVAAFCK